MYSDQRDTRCNPAHCFSFHFDFHFDFGFAVDPRNASPNVAQINISLDCYWIFMRFAGNFQPRNSSVVTRESYGKIWKICRSFVSLEFASKSALFRCESTRGRASSKIADSYSSVDSRFEPRENCTIKSRIKSVSVKKERKYRVKAIGDKIYKRLGLFHATILAPAILIGLALILLSFALTVFGIIYPSMMLLVLLINTFSLCKSDTRPYVERNK